MSNKKIGLLSLTALVLSSMIGSGIFSLPQNMAEVAGAYSHRPWDERSGGGQPRRHFCESVSVGFIYRLDDLFLLSAHLHAGYGGRVA